MLYPSKSSLFQIHHYISENYQTYRGTQFNLTLSITNQNTSRLSTQLNIFWSIFNTLLSYKFIILTLYPLNSSWIYIKYPTFQKTITVIAEHSLKWHFRLPIKHFSPINANKYILKHLQHTFQLLIYHTLVLYPSKSSLFKIHHYISENYQTYRGQQFNLTLSITNQNTSRLSTQLNIFWSIFNTLFSY